MTLSAAAPLANDDQQDGTQLAAKDWQQQLDALVRDKQWQHLWDLVGKVPLGQSIDLLTQLKQCDWTPTAKRSQTALATLTHYAKRCEGAAPQMCTFGVT